MYPTEHSLIFSGILDFLKHFLTIFKRIRTKPNHTMSSPKRWSNASTALGHKLMSSAQRWADHQCCRCAPPPCPDYKTPISGDCFDFTVQDVGIWQSAVYCWFVLFTWQYIRPGNITISLFFAAWKLFFLIFLYFQLRSVGYIASYTLNFQNWQHWNCLIPRGPFK